MKSSKNEQITDELIGEAVLSLLHDKGPINTLSLIARLQTMQSNEQDNQRRRMLARLVEEISHSHIISASDGTSTEQNVLNKGARDNVYPLFGNRQRQGRSKKH
jgi:hypothetical protein